jgi:acetylornithine deacetylase/succinyl-diaminopimelate desuccinylase-like protein
MEMSAPSATDQAVLYQRPAELLQNLIRFNTTNPPGNEAECIDYIDHLLTKAGLETTLLAKDSNRPNLIARLKGQGNAPPLLLQGHVDVVTTENQTWQQSPFEARIVDGWVWGRGALDMKSGVAMMLAAFLRARAERVNLPGDIVLCILSDEERGSEYGAKYLVENHASLFEGIRYAIGEFGGFAFYIGKKRFYPIMVAEKQPYLIRATVRGPSGHASFLLRGGAMAKLSRLLQQLDQRRLPTHVTPVVRQMCETVASALSFPLNLIFRQLLNPVLTDKILGLLGTKGRSLDALLHNTVNATTVRGGEQIWGIPSEVVIELAANLLPGYHLADLLTELHQILGDEVELELVGESYEAAPAEPDMGLFDMLTGILHELDPDGIPLPLLSPAPTDGRHFSRLGIQTYGFLPMNLPEGFDFLETMHAADERISVEALDFGTAAIYKALQRFGMR